MREFHADCVKMPLAKECSSPIFLRFLAKKPCGIIVAKGRFRQVDSADSLLGVRWLSAKNKNQQKI